MLVPLRPFLALAQTVFPRLMASSRRVSALESHLRTASSIAVSGAGVTGLDCARGTGTATTSAAATAAVALPSNHESTTITDDMTNASPSLKTFPVSHLVPRAPTGADKLASHIDGRGTVVAILDTGVDPAAVGLLTRPDGGRKVVDVVDCTGSGDVTLTGPTNLSPDGTVPSPHTGRLLRLPANHTNPSGEYYLGMKRGYDLFPGPLVTRVKKDRKDAFEKGHHALVSRLTGELAALNSAPNSAPASPNSAAGSTTPTAVVGSSGAVAAPADGEASKPKEDRPASPSAPALTKAEKTQDLKDRLDALKDMMSKYDDPGPTFDCVVWNDGNHWVACIDVTESGDLTAQPTLASYHIAQQHHSFPTTLLTFSVNIYDPPPVPNTSNAPRPTLSLVTNAGSHGTHVAGIAAAFHGQGHPENGMAPGASIVSLKIGDTRLGSMETGHGLARAAIYLSNPLPFAPSTKIDVANLSYGEPTALPSLGAFPQLLKTHVTNGANVTFVASGGNEGPGLTTVGAPGGTSDGLIGVGAWVSPGMMKAGYGLWSEDVLGPEPESDKGDKGRIYTWSSRGPAADGHTGVSIFAPGGAVTSIPKYNLAPTQLMNGTSMSAPNFSGAVSLALSALRQSNIPWTPYAVKRAFENTASPLGDEFMKGLAQIPAALDWLSSRPKANPEDPFSPYDLEYSVTFPEIPSALGPGNPARGLYLRANGLPASSVQTTVSIGVVWPNDLADTGAGLYNSMKATLDLRLRLECTARSTHLLQNQPDKTETNPSWIRFPDHLVLNNGGKQFPIKVDTADLPIGMHYAEITGFIDGDESRGPLFRAPITVLKPLEVPDSSTLKFPNCEFQPATVLRRFIATPPHANFATLTFRTKPRSTQARFFVQLNYGGPGIPQTRSKKSEVEYVFTVGGNPEDGDPEVQVRHFRVLPSQTLELCVAQFWSSAGDTVVDIDIEFRGLWVSGGAGTMGVGNLGGGSVWVNGATGPMGARVEVWSPLRKEKLNLSASFDTLRRSVAPNKEQSLVVPLKSRDVHPSGKQLHALTLVYEVKVPATDSGSVTFHFPWITDLLYDSPFDGFLMMVHDWAKRLITTRDVYPKPVTLHKQGGEYTVRAQLISSSVEALDRVVKEGWPMLMDLKCKSTSLSVYANQSGTLLPGKTGAGDKVIGKGERRVMFLGGVSPDSLPKEANPGDVLVGELKVWGGPVGSNDNGGNTAINGGLAGISYVVPSEQPKSKSNGGDKNGGSASKPEEKDEATQLKEAVRDVEIGMIGKLKDVEKRNSLIKKLEEEFLDHLPLLVAKLDAVQSEAVGDAEKAGKAEPFDGDKAKAATEAISSVVALADKIIGLANGTIPKSSAAAAPLDGSAPAPSGQNELALFFAGKPDTSSDAAKQIKKEMDQRKDTMVSAMLKKAQALKAAADLQDAISKSSSSTDSTRSTTNKPFEDFMSAWLDYAKWSDNAGSPEKDSKMVLLHVWKERRRGALGSALKVVNKYLDEPPSGDCTRGSKGATIKSMSDVRLELVKEIFGGENVWAEYEKQQQLMRYPKEFAPF